MPERRCPPLTEKYTIKQGDTLYKIALEYNTTIQVLLFLNPFINPNNLMIGQVICVPKKTTRPPCEDGVYYTIKAGDTFYSIADEYDVTVRELQLANPFVNPYNLMIGQVICIPKQIKCPGGKIHVIEQGDTFYKLAQKYDISYKALIDANPNLDPENLQIGQKICIPPYEPAELCPGGKTYIIKEGDTLSSIAEQFVVSATDILKYNPELSPSEFVPGRRICIPPEAPV